KTWYFFASATNFVRMAFTFSGYFDAMSSVWLKSLFRLYSWKTCFLSGSGFAGPKACHGARLTLVLSIQPSSYNAHCPIISKYWVLWREGTFAFFASKV